MMIISASLLLQFEALKKNVPQIYDGMEVLFDLLVPIPENLAPLPQGVEDMSVRLGGTAEVLQRRLHGAAFSPFTHTIKIDGDVFPCCGGLAKTFRLLKNADVVSTTVQWVFDPTGGGRHSYRLLPEIQKFYKNLPPEPAKLLEDCDTKQRCAGCIREVAENLMAKAWNSTQGVRPIECYRRHADDRCQKIRKQAAEFMRH